MSAQKAKALTSHERHFFKIPDATVRIAPTGRTMRNPKTCGCRIDTMKQKYLLARAFLQSRQCRRACAACKDIAKGLQSKTFLRLLYHFRKASSTVGTKFFIFLCFRQKKKCTFAFPPKNRAREESAFLSGKQYRSDRGIPFTTLRDRFRFNSNFR